MKKLLMLVPVMMLVMCCTVFLFACGKDSSEGDSQVNVENESETGKEGNGGGNPNKDNNEDELKVVSILVSDDEYFYQNEPISLEDILAMLDDMEDEFYVELKDNNATHKAYNALVKALEEREISFEE